MFSVIALFTTSILVTKTVATINKTTNMNVQHWQHHDFPYLFSQSVCGIEWHLSWAPCSAHKSFPHGYHISQQPIFLVHIVVATFVQPSIWHKLAIF